ncbi:hypothetical protein [Streptomyces mirabilis]|uniref:hypothetical protein n=1 Tax=Streptomyces mirabilis TaxID=68239 RepID=UPI00225C2686|nr:hypothetical protein [Streptomyces mirabilis]MCX4608719.1 hypothetical protein [Streptomyces mirabilis]
MSRTFSAADEERLRQLHADGVSRNEIARQMGWSVGTVPNHAQHLRLSSVIVNREVAWRHSHPQTRPQLP